ncbi:MAG: Holliday junction branch migration protein RuvA [Candidatus Gracilibacteria bacterium]|nr:Holliday junction branch migration protein RuvA [Candidatus Gracilibacteria bacterium]
MIAYLKGQIIDLNENNVVILTGSGIGYEVFISSITFADLGGQKEIELHIYNHITENSNLLFGFLKKQEKEVFLELIKISGVGGKVALNILSLGINRLSEAVINNDNKTIESVNGIGKKGASKIILELQDKEIIQNVGVINSNSGEKVVIKQYDREIYETLVNMGFNAKKVAEVLGNLPDEIEGAEKIIPYAIKHLS